ncbi:MAG TPA: Rrf2 family transcriptional regulator [Saprospiraceae bacterium]|nr:Rrf2 family transcriptional regulator [Saprospiraceae bacterium]
MKINAIDEYGLRILIRLAKEGRQEGLSISQLSELEGLSGAYVAKLTRMLRAGGLINSNRGNKGGYVLAMNPKEITVCMALQALGGALFESGFCASHAGNNKFCTHSVDCSVRSLWRMVQTSMDQLLNQITIYDLLGSEKQSREKLQFIFDQTVSKKEGSIIEFTEH